MIVRFSLLGYRNVKSSTLLTNQRNYKLISKGLVVIETHDR